MRNGIGCTIAIGGSVLFLIVGILSVAMGLGPGANPVVGADPGGNVAGFWTGILHGFTLIFTLIGSLVSDNIGIYETHNTGAGYNIGFFLGAVSLGGGIGSTAKNRD